MKILRIGILFIATMMAACSGAEQSGQAGAENQSGEAAKAVSQKEDRQFGEAVTADGAISYAEMLEQLRGQDSIEVKVAGTVNKVCQKKGCWMTITDETASAETMMVRFKDYGFFVPMDIGGREVVFEGKAYREITPVDELRHLAQDAGKSQEEIDAITEPKEELKFLASGVLLLEN